MQRVKTLEDLEKLFDKAYRHFLFDLNDYRAYLVLVSELKRQIIVNKAIKDYLNKYTRTKKIMHDRMYNEIVKDWLER